MVPQSGPRGLSSSDIGFAGSGRSHAVLGAGAVGLATARLIQQRGGQVTLYAESLPPDTTSNIAGGQWHTSWLFEREAVDDAFRAQFQQAARLSHRHFQTLVGGPYGVSWRRNYFVYDERHDFGPMDEGLRDLMPEMTVLEPGQHPFGRHYVQRFTAMPSSRTARLSQTGQRSGNWYGCASGGRWSSTTPTI